MGYGARIDSTRPIHYGRYAAKMRASALPGCVTGFVMMSPGKDEIDFEWVGKNAATTQTNYYVKGQLDYTKGFIANNGYDISQSFHEYAVEWQLDHISWFIDGNLIRTVDTSSNIGLPAEPGNLIFSLWDGGAGLPGTSDWAGGKIDWSSPLLENGATYSEIEYVSYTC
ncbi:glycoside hydrolase family 16 protein [Conidiobolus coronatus NRRL 28638]|uniref:Glycoside hydrolase family 16 protein n=1 Tax=Conidiobolus coronatus (strain ATCC 28846 / CBS 209.66 / NRRL 28638) TaxID=796925 RepID=A0A137PDG6_CONC2|nr:glycoside hydrolase family 16 protein [Conidiobolus coronatus NRRL 28638]|eukprot:KXN73049.1 glycoside hydrolase family 16 protein [Conidiobolus coronatus NRRL 28638]